MRMITIALIAVLAFNSCLAVDWKAKSKEELLQAVISDERALRRDIIKLARFPGEKGTEPVPEVVAVPEAVSAPAVDEHAGTVWSKMLESAAKPTEQLFGVEIEFKRTKIPYTSKTDKRAAAFFEFAKTKGHLPLFDCQVKDIGLQVHLDQGTDGKSALLELVTNPPQSAANVAKALYWLRTVFPVCNDLKCASLRAHLADETIWKRHHVGAEFNTVYEYVLSNVFKQGGALTWLPNMLQVTTTNTAAQLAKIKPMWMPPFKCTGCTQDQIIEQLCKLKPFQDKGKGTKLLIKHACQQFTGKETVGSPTLTGTTVVGKLKKDHNFGLLTLGNKLAPIFKRPTGEIAFVVEYRGAAGNVEKCVVDALKGALDKLKSGVEACLQTIM